jgi:hypothetical protein
VIEVWATVTGTDGIQTNDGLTFNYFGLLSANTDTVHLAGGLTNSSAVLSPFTDAASFNNGTFADRNADTIGDWRGTATSGASALNGWAKASFSLSTTQFGGGTVGQSVGPNSWAFHIADAVFQIGSISTAGIVGTQNVLRYNPVIPAPLSLATRANWQEDGVSKNGSAGPTLGTSVLFTLTGSAAANDTVITASSPVNLGNYLLNGVKTPGNSTLNKTGTQPTTYTATPSNNGLTVGATGSFGNGPQIELIALSLTSNANGNGTYGPKSYTVTVDNTASDSAAPGQGSDDPDDIINVTANVGLATTSGTALGAPLTGNVGPGGSYAGLASKTTTGIESGAKVLGTEAIMIGGSNAGGGQPEVVQMAWRARRNNEKGNSEGGAPTSPPLPAGVRTLISDVVDLTGMTYQGAGAAPGRTDPYVLQMSYDETLLGSAARETLAAQRGRVYLAWLNPDGAGVGVPQWQNAITGDFTVNTGVTNFQGSWAAAGNTLVVGSWGVDTAANVVWAVIDHTSEFGVVPEPSSIMLLGIGAVGLFVGVRRRRRQTA